MNFVDLNPHELLGLSKQAWEAMQASANDWPLNFRYHLDETTVVNVESSAKRLSEGVAKHNFDNQIIFWRSILDKLHAVGMAGKLTENNRYVATVVRLADSKNGVINFRVSP